MVKILIAEDEAIERKYLTQLIQGMDREKIQVTASCSDGEEAVDEARIRRPDILILDIQMPKKNGLEAAREIRAMNPAVRILILTAFGEFEYAKAAIRIGVDDYFVKPGSDEQLLEKIAALAEKVEEEKARQEAILRVKGQLEHYDRLLVGELITSVIFSRKDSAAYFRDYIGLRHMEMKAYACCVIDLEPDQPVPDDVIRQIEGIFHAGGCQCAIGRYQNEITILLFGDRELRLENLREEIQKELFRLSGNTCLCEFSPVCQNEDDILTAYQTVKNEIERQKKSEKGKEPLREILYQYETRWLEAAVSGTAVDCGAEAAGFCREVIRGQEGLLQAQNGIYLLYMWLTKDIIRFFNRKIQFERIGDIRERIYLARDFQVLQNLAAELLQEILAVTKEEKARKEDKLVLMVAEYLKGHFQENLSLNQVAEEFQMSSYHLSKMFRKTMGKTFIEYLTELRIGRAKSLLMDGGLTVTEIAFSVGYQDSGYFSKVFRKATGLSPREFSDSVSKT